MSTLDRPKASFARTVWRALRKELEPADDLELIGTNGARVTGVLIVEDNRIRGGVVFDSDKP